MFQVTKDNAVGIMSANKTTRKPHITDIDKPDDSSTHREAFTVGDRWDDINRRVVPFEEYLRNEVFLNDVTDTVASHANVDTVNVD